MNKELNSANGSCSNLSNDIKEYDSDVRIKIGNRIQESRLKSKMIGADLGAYIGINANQVSRIERGEANCDISKLFVICQCLGVTADYLLFGERNRGYIISDSQMLTIQSLIGAF